MKKKKNIFLFVIAAVKTRPVFKQNGKGFQGKDVQIG